MVRHTLPFCLSCLVACSTPGAGPGDFPDDSSTANDDDDDAPAIPDAGPSTDPDTTPDDSGSSSGDSSGSSGDASGDSGTTGPVDPSCRDAFDDACEAQESCGDAGEGNGSDDDCDGEVDEGCACTPGDVVPCFAGSPGQRDMGACTDGTMRCEGDAVGSWGACTGGISPTNEICDGLDNDCDGCPEDADRCDDAPALLCPGPGDLPDGTPFQAFVIDGTSFYAGPFESWQWTVTGGPCDQLLDETTGITSFTIAGDTTPELTIEPTLSGDYTVQLDITLADGAVLTCTFVVHVGAPGLRVELCWDTTGSADLDLHLHRPGSEAPWLIPQGNDDCGFSNCTAGDQLSGNGADWELPSSDLDACSGTSEGAMWEALGSCANPRLDIDNVIEPGVPENINVDVPDDGTHRIMVHYYGGGVVTRPMVNVYCGGTLVSTQGAAPDLVDGFEAGSSGASAPRWRVADVTTTTIAGETTCDVAPLHPPDENSGAWVDYGNTAY